MTVRILHDDENLTVAVTESRSNSVILCFTGIGHALGGVDVQSPEFTRASKDATAFFIVDKTRSWGNKIDFELLRALIMPIAEGKSIFTLGNSMGGFLAILATRFFNIRSAVAFVPQYTVSKLLLPHETRWNIYVDEIKVWRFESLEGSFNDQTNFYVIGGLGGDDDKHLERFPSLPNVHRIYFLEPEFMHNAAAFLKEQGLLYPVIEECLKGRSAQDIAHSCLTGYRLAVVEQ